MDDNYFKLISNELNGLGVKIKQIEVDLIQINEKIELNFREGKSKDLAEHLDKEKNRLLKRLEDKKKEHAQLMQQINRYIGFGSILINFLIQKIFN